jgi:hypothetical protein
MVRAPWRRQKVQEQRPGRIAVGSFGDSNLIWIAPQWQEPG